MNCKFSVLLDEAISDSWEIGYVSSNRSRLPNFFLHCHFRVLAAGSRARGGGASSFYSIVVLNIFCFGEGRLKFRFN